MLNRLSNKYVEEEGNSKVNCLVDVLKVLRGSSKEAVENTDAFNPFKRYMHIKRNLEDKLSTIITEATNAAHKQLILVCGSVGDGKSHLLSYLKNEKKILDGFVLHNDATESLTPEMTSIETLDQILRGFRDENLYDEKRERVIVAVNLGTLNNFIESPIGRYYSKLHEYVINSGILESYTDDAGYSETSYFQHINFSDYHLYELVKDGTHIDSTFIRSIIDKILNEDPENEFYKGYRKCIECRICDRCPVKHNYEFLGNEQVQNAIIDILVEAMIKHKIIISTRSLLNFFYDILVGDEFSREKYMSLNEEDQVACYIKMLMPNLIYGHPDISIILEEISKNDPMSVRSGSMDEVIIKFNILDDVLSLMKSCVTNNIYFDTFKQVDVNKFAKQNKELKQKLLECFIRLYKLVGIEGKLDIEDQVYREFISCLYAYNANDLSGLRELYECLEEAIFKWKGNTSKGKVVVSVGNNRFNYKISQELKIEEYIEDKVSDNSTVIERFVPYIIAGICDKDEQQKEKINIDYALFKLIRDIKNGYRPNIKDKNDFISFVNAIERIHSYGEKKKELVIETKNLEFNHKYIFKKTKFGFRFEGVE